MHRRPTEWRSFGDGFIPVSQTDDFDEGNRERRSVREFRSRVQQVLQQSTITHDDGQGSAHGSPAFSDTTLVAHDYLDVPIRHYEEVDIGSYPVEYYGSYYGPEATSLSPSPSTKAGLGLEVRSWPVASDLSPGGLYVDDPWNNISYRGSEGKIEEELPREPHNYKPFVLRGKFLVGLFLTLVILIPLAELAIQLLPHNSMTATPPQGNENTTGIRRRYMFTNGIDLTGPSTPLKRQHNPNHDNNPSATAPSASSSSEAVTNTMTATGDKTTASTPITMPQATTIITSETQPSATSPPSQATSSTSPSPPQAETSITSQSLSFSTTTSLQAETSTPSSSVPRPPDTTSDDEPPPAVTSSEDSPQPPYTPPPVSASVPISLPGHEVPASSHESYSSDSSTLATSSVLSSTNVITTTSQTGDPGPLPTTDHPGDPATLTSSAESSIPLPTYTEGTSPPVTPTLPPSSLPTDPNEPKPDPSSSDTGSTPPLPTDSGPTTNPTVTLPTQPPPPPPTSSSKPIPDPPTTAVTSSISVTFSSSMTTIDSPSITTPSSSNSYSTDSSITNTIPPGNEPSSTLPNSSVESVTSTEEVSSSSSTSMGSSTTIDITVGTTDHVSETIPPSHSEPYSETSPTSNTITATSLSQTIQPSSSSSEPFPTSTTFSAEQTTLPPITTTIVTSVTRSDGVFIETTFVSVIHPIKAELDDSVTDYVTIYTDSNGRLTTETVLAYASTTTIIYTDAHGIPTSTQTSILLRLPMQTTLLDYQGRATKTESYYTEESTETLYDKDHHPTATRIATITELISLITLSDSNGVPTKTITDLIPLAPASSTTTKVVKPISTASSNSEGNMTLHVIPVSDGKYFLGLMFPTFVAIVVSIPIRILDQTAKLYQPFHVLASRGGQARDTLLFQTSGIWNFAGRIRSLLNGQILLTLTGLLVLGSVIMIPLSSEAVRIVLEGPDCSAAKGDTLICTMAVGIYSVPAQIAVALLVFMAVLVGLIIMVLRKWNTGLDWNPWSLYHMGRLAANNDVRTLLQRRLREKDGRITIKQAEKALGETPFVINYWRDNETLTYSILIPNEAQSLKKDGRSVTFGKGKASRMKRKGEVIPFFILTWTGRLLFLLLLCAVMIGLLIYTITGDGQTCTRFMMGKWRVVRFILTFIGVLISLIWGSLFYAVAFLSPHKLFHRIRLYNGDAVHMTPPSNPFSGLKSSLTPGRRDIYLGLVSAIAILSEVIPVLISTALDQCTERFWAHTVCLWMAIAILSIMMLTVTGSFFVSWPHMPIDPSTIAGGMYYALTKYMPMSPSSGLLFGRVSPGVV
ncbi:hypothetical protein K449DRAFT_440801 [Hypoxylon sp. EC38]|nr:hypothetical protein K449DRAFT_440801 [Hypoxylon sp. EC38]